MCVLVGISRDDTDKDLEYIAKKILSIRLFENPEETASSGKWNKNVVDRDFEVLCISQFTLQSTLKGFFLVFCSIWLFLNKVIIILKGTKPDFHLAMSSEQSKEFYQKFLDLLKKTYKEEKIKDGRFGAYMKVDIQNDGPVTILLDSKKTSEKSEKNNDE